MPDISMCDSETCPLKTNCYRNPASGTKPSEFRQSWFRVLTGWGEDCRYYWPKEEDEWETAPAAKEGRG